MIKRKIYNRLCDFYRNSPKALLLSGANVSTAGNTKYLPIYMLMFLHREESIDLLYKVDLPTL